MGFISHGYVDDTDGPGSAVDRHVVRKKWASTFLLSVLPHLPAQKHTNEYNQVDRSEVVNFGSSSRSNSEGISTSIRRSSINDDSKVNKNNICDATTLVFLLHINRGLSRLGFNHRSFIIPLRNVIGQCEAGIIKWPTCTRKTREHCQICGF